MSAPIFDQRTAATFFADAIALAKLYCPQWGLPADDALTANAIAQDPGLVLLQLFSLLGQDLANVQNAIPMQRQLALYRFLDMRLRPAACASAPLCFSLAPKHASVFLPRGTVVVDASTRRLRFETDSDLQVLPATLRTVLTVEPRLDRYFDVQSSWAAGEPAPAFPGRANGEVEHRFAHALLLGDAALFKPSSAARGMTLTLHGERLDPDYFRCWYDAALNPLHPTVVGSSNGTSCTVAFGALPVAATQTVAALHVSLAASAGRRLDATDPSLALCPSTPMYWLVCKPIDSARVVPALNGYLPKIDAIWCDFGTLSVAPQQAIANGLGVDLRNGAYPFGQTPTLDASFCIRCDAAFSRPGVPIKMTFDLRPLANDPDAQVEWQYWSGASWSTLTAANDPYQFVDGTVNLTIASGSVSFICPVVVQTSVTGTQGMWIRAVLNTGGYGDVKNGFEPPFVRSLVIEYACGGAPSAVWAHNAFELIALPARPYEPYRSLAEGGAALYLSFAASDLLTYGLDQQLTLYIDVDPADEHLGHSSPGEWQWFDATRSVWRPLAIDVSEVGLARSRVIRFTVPSQLQAAALFSETACWFRVLCPHRKHALKVRGIYPNTVNACNRATYGNEVLGSSNGQPGQRFSLSAIAATPSGTDQVLLAISADPHSAVQVQVVEPVTSEPIAIAMSGSQTQQTAVFAWTRVDSFVGHGPNDRVFMVDVVTGTIVFGDGSHGAVPPPGRNNIIATCYATTRGAVGNLAAGALSVLYSAVPGITQVTNPIPARGGADADRVDDLIESGPALVRANDRAVSAADIEALARVANAGVCRVRAIEYAAAPMLHEPDPLPIEWSALHSAQILPDMRRWPRLELIVLAKSSDAQPLTPMSMLDDVVSYVRARSMPWLAARTTARRPSFKPIDVTVLLQTNAPKSQWAALRANITAQLTRFLHPTLGGTAANGWPIGEPMRYVAIHLFLLGSSAMVTAVVAMTLCGKTGDVSLDPDQVSAVGAIDIRLTEASQS
ncbi:baseplate J/gp47 family protein [Trinickia acidisoli]|uniref:baseplate J/gp47 family protein n=1 Tax=Trinickia acidisoli TaxID=2767482 RepID=UPI001A8C6C31|nr:baseplate J/gp47 family protein [Trinickia acidisoli]